MWMRRDWTRAGLATVTAFSLTAGSYWFLGATPKDAQPPTVVITQPALSLNGCQVKVRLAANSPAVTRDPAGTASMTMLPGPLPQFQMEAANPGTTPATIHFTANLRITSMVDFGGRSAPPAPAPSWSQDFTLTLKPGQTQLVPIATGAKFKNMDMAMFSLQNGKQQVTALTLTAVTPQPAAAKQPDAAAAQPVAKQVAQAGQ